MKYLPIELLHYSGMTDEYLPEVQQILSAQPELITSTTQYGDNALMLAAKAGNMKIVDFLLKNGADITMVSQDGGALLMAYKNNKEDVVDFFIKHYSDCINQTDSSGKNLLFYAISDNNYILVSDILNSDTAVEISENQNNFLLEAVYAAIKINSVAIFSMLCEYLLHHPISPKKSDLQAVYNTLIEQDMATDIGKKMLDSILLIYTP